MTIDTQLHNLSAPRKVKLELTTRCNLRCRYCHFRHLPPLDLSPSQVRELLVAFKNLGVASIELSGNGETTVAPHWREIANEMLGTGFIVSMISNLIKPFDDDEINALRRFESIAVSWDTADPDLFHELRPPGRLEQLEKNIDSLLAGGNSSVRITCASVVTSQTVFGLPDLVERAFSKGIKGFYFRQLEHSERTASANIRNLRALSSLQRVHARNCLEEAVHRARDKGAMAFVMPALADELVDPPVSNAIREQRRSRVTKDCLDPWTYLFINAQREIMPCCYHAPVGELEKGGDLQSVLQSSALVQLKQGLLEGNLDVDCSRCPERSEIPVEDLHVRLKNGVGALAALEEQIRIWRREERRVLIYGAGEHTSMLLKTTALGNANLVGICDASCSCYGATRHGLKICHPRDIYLLVPDVILVSSKAFQDDIVAFLSTIEIGNAQVVTLY